MKAYEVLMGDRFQNVGLDCELFATRAEAEKAIEIAATMYEGFDGVVIEREAKDPTITLQQWEESGW
jgi:hypothetical protein